MPEVVLNSWRYSPPDEVVEPGHRVHPFNHHQTVWCYDSGPPWAACSQEGFTDLMLRDLSDT